MKNRTILVENVIMECNDLLGKPGEGEVVCVWETYESRRGHVQDFDVRYRFYSTEEGGRKSLPFQGYRCDFLYENEDPKVDSLYMIHPEFEDEHGALMLDIDRPVNREGTARMWILIPEMRGKVHRNRIKTGTKGFFMEGSRRVGEVEVTRVVGLMTNPIKDT